MNATPSTPLRVWSPVGLLLSMLVLASCSDGPTDVRPTAPPSVIEVGHPELTGTVGQPLPDPVLVRILDEKGDPVQNATVRFAPPAGSAVDPEQTHTDRDGLARALWTLPTRAGPQTLTVTVPGAAVGELMAEIVATAVADAPASIEMVSGDRQVAPPYVTLLDPLRVLVRDQYGNPVDGAEISWLADAGQGTVAPGVTFSDSQGIAQAMRTTGSTLGSQLTTAGLDAADESVVFVTTVVDARALLPVALRVYRGNGQSAKVATSPAHPYSVQVLDANGYPVSNASVRWTVASGGGLVFPEVSRTNAQGVATAVVRFGEHSGQHVTRAEIQGLNTPTDFVGLAVPGDPASLSRLGSASQSTEVGTVTAEPLQVVVRDSFGNPVPGTDVAWSVVSGGGQLSTSRVPTRTNGEAAVAFTAGTEAGTATVTATLSGVSGSPVTYTITQTPGPLARIEASSGDAQLGVAGTQLPIPFVARVADQYGNAIQGTTIQWAISSGSGSLSKSTGVSGEEGTMSVYYTPLSEGSHRILARAESLTGPVAAFNMTTAKAAVAVVRGNDQTALVDSLFSDSLVVRVSDPVSGAPLQGIAVSWIADEQGGEVSPTPSITDADGLAAVERRAGSVIGLAQTRAVVAGDTATFVHRIVGAHGEALLQQVSGDNQVGLVGQKLPRSLTVRVVDDAGAPVSGVTVRWAILNPTVGAALDAATSTTGTDGLASMNVTMPQVSGASALVQAKVDGIATAVTFSALASASSVLNFVKVSGDNQRGTPGFVLPAPMVVRITDATGAGLAGRTVIFSVTRGDGGLAKTASVGSAQTLTVETDQDGLALAWRSIEGAQAHETTATVLGQPGLGTLTFAGEVGQPSYSFALASGNAQNGEKAALLPAPLVVRVTDATGAGVAGLRVSFAVTKGQVRVNDNPETHINDPSWNIARIVETDSRGYATVWAYVVDHGDFEISVNIVGFSFLGTTTFTGTVTPPAP